MASPLDIETKKPVVEVFSELGDLVEDRWRSHNYDEILFPQIAAAALSELQLSHKIDPWAIIRWVQTTPNLPAQQDLKAKFGDPPITLYAGPRFYIDVYYWLDGTTSIHQHSFSGAFQVLLGSSVHSHYRFEKETEINPHLLIGQVLLEEVTLLQEGDVRQIIPGPAYIHSLFHLERPSATITVRTHSAPSAPVQFSYRIPFIAQDPFFNNASLIRNVQTTSLLLRMKHPDADKFIGELLDSADFQTAYAVLEQAFNFLCHRDLEEALGVTRSNERFQHLTERARRKHGAIVDLLLPVFEEEWRQNEIVRRRGEVKGQEHRFFLALLLNVPHRNTVLRLIRERFPDHDPVELVVRWVKELTATKTFGSKEPNVLGIGEFDENHLFVFANLLRGVTIDEIQTAAIERQMMPAAVADLADHIQSLVIFKSLFQVE